MAALVSRVSLGLVYGLAVLITLVFPTPVLDKPKESGSAVIFWNVGQGDFASIIDGNHCLFIDIGGDKNLPLMARQLIKTSCIGRVSSLFISHYDRDHIRNFQQLFSMTTISKVYISHVDVRTRLAKTFLNTLKTKRIETQLLRAGDVFATRNLNLKCLWPPKNFHASNENDWSEVFIIRVGEKSILFTGDLPGKSEQFVHLAERTKTALILKVAHHGSKTSSSTPFLERLKPTVCIISSGKRNRYRHPNQETLARLARSGCVTMRTDTLGNIAFQLR